MRETVHLRALAPGVSISVVRDRAVGLRALVVLDDSTGQPPRRLEAAFPDVKAARAAVDAARGAAVVVPRAGADTGALEGAPGTIDTARMLALWGEEGGT